MNNIQITYKMIALP